MGTVYAKGVGTIVVLLLDRLSRTFTLWYAIVPHSLTIIRFSSWELISINQDNNMFGNNDLEQIVIPYWDAEVYFDKACKVIIDNFGSSYKNLLNGHVSHWDCDIFFDELKGQRNRGTKNHYLTLGYKLSTNLDSDKERELVRSSEFSRGVIAIKRSLLEKYGNVISGISINDPCNIFYVHLTKEKSRELLLSSVGKNFNYDSDILQHPDRIYDY